MRLPSRNAEAEDVNVGLPDTHLVIPSPKEEAEVTAVPEFVKANVTVDVKAQSKEQEFLTDTRQDLRQYLELPLRGPIRPLSPDTLSNLSAEEYEQLHEAQPVKLDDPSPTTFKGKLRAAWVRNLGLFYMLVAQLFGSIMNLTTRILEVEGNGGKGFHPFQVLFARMSITVILASTYMWYKKTPDFPFGKREVRLLLICRGLGGFFGVFGMYYSLLYLPLSDAVVLTFLAPGISCWICSMLIKEPFTRVEKLATLVSFLGVILIARPISFFRDISSDTPVGDAGDITPGSNSTMRVPDASDYDHVTPEERFAAVGIALIGVMGAVCAFVTIRWIGKRAHPLISVNYFAVWCTLVSIVMQLALPDLGFVLPADLKDWGLLLLLGTCGFIMQFLMAAGLAYEKSSRATNMTYTSMLFALSFDKFFFQITPGIWSIMGSTLILGSAISMAVQKSLPVKDNPAPAEARQDEEIGLMRAVEGGAAGSADAMPLQAVQLRALRLED